VSAEAERSWCWRGKGSCAWGPRTIKHTNKFGGGSVIIWGSMSALDPGICSIFDNVTPYGRANYDGMRIAVTRIKGIGHKIGYPVVEEFFGSNDFRGGILVLVTVFQV